MENQTTSKNFNKSQKTLKQSTEQPYNNYKLKTNNMETTINKPTNQEIYNKLINSPICDKAKQFVEALNSQQPELFQDFLNWSVGSEYYSETQKPAASEFAPSFYNPFKVMDDLAAQPAIAKYPKYIQSIVFVMVPSLRPFAMAWAA